MSYPPALSPPSPDLARPQFCDFNSDPLLVCKAINDLEAMEENYDSFGEPQCCSPSGAGPAPVYGVC